MAYVPPGLRKKQQNTVTESVSALDSSASGNVGTVALPSLDDIQKHFWPTPTIDEKHLTDNDGDQETVTTDKDDVRVTSATDNHTVPSSSHPTVRKSHSTLNATEAEPNRLRYVLLFHNSVRQRPGLRLLALIELQHPRWKEDKIIYVKTDLHLLPQEADTAASNESPGGLLAQEVMVFDQSLDFVSQIASRARFKFLGFYNLERMQILEPKTPELVRMLEQKWTRTNKWGRSRQIERDSKGWQKSLNHSWAILKFTKADVAGVKLSPPKIEIQLNDNRSRGKENEPQMFVNEMLRDLRLQSRAKVVPEEKSEVALQERE